MQLLSARRIIWTVIVLGSALFLAANMAFAAIYADRILPGVKVGSVNVGGMSRAQARGALSRQAEQFSVQVELDNKIFTVDPRRFGGRYDVEATVSQAYLIGRQRVFDLLGWWMDARSDGQIKLAYNMNRPQLQAYVSGFASQNSIAPIDARIVIQSGKVKVEPDKAGLAIDKNVLLEKIDASLASFTTKPIVVNPTPVAAAVQVNDTNAAVNLAKQIMNLKVTLTYEGRAFKPSANEIGSWIAFKSSPSQKVVPYIDSSRVKGYMQSVAAAVDVAPVNKKVDLINGVAKVIQEGKEGKSIDQDGAVAAIAAGLEERRSVEHALVSKSVPYKTINTEVVSLEGGRYIEVNLTLQRLWLWDNNQVILTSPITSGASGAGFPTVTGLFAIYYKTTNTYLNGRPYGWDYYVHVDYWMPFYKGYGLHDASWRNGVFGGQDYIYNGSHGCVNLPLDTAAFIYNWAAVGTPVWVHK